MLLFKKCVPKVRTYLSQYFDGLFISKGKIINFFTQPRVTELNSWLPNMDICLMCLKVG